VGQVTGPQAYEQSMALQVRGLVKRFGPVVAVAGVDLDVPRGSFFGLVGPNGAGKTTTLAMVTGLLRPDAGGARVDGVDVWADPLTARGRMGVLPEGLRMFERLSGRELLAFTGRLRGMPPAEVDERAAELLSVLGLADATQLVVDYSTGMRKKVALAAALLHNPPVLFLDEPFEAVDPVSARTIREVLRAFTGRGGTVVLSSHVMDLVERICDDVAVMAGGRVLAAGTVDAVRGGRSLEEVFVELVGGAVGVGDGGLDWLGVS
jgi:ABC-2 type transport system ATP-binding protein